MTDGNSRFEPNPPKDVREAVEALRHLERAVTGITRADGISSERIKRELGWAPHYPSWRQGFAEGLG